MKWRWSEWGSQLKEGSGIEQLMDDLGRAMAEGGGDVKMLGGGNPARIPAVEKIWKRHMESMLEGDDFERLVSTYDPPSGSPRFLEAFAKFLNNLYGWEVGPENLAVAPGGQTAFYCLFQLLADKNKQIVLPITPEYIGYANQGGETQVFRATQPGVELVGDTEFQYKINFGALQLGRTTGAVCLSRPTNPSGNVISDAEMDRLIKHTDDAGVPLLVDNAYGHPFPGIIYTDATPRHAPHMVQVFSLSKIGLPGTRTSIVLGPKEIVKAVTSMVAVIGLSNPGLGQRLFQPLLERKGRLLKLVNDHVRPFYQAKMEKARGWLQELMPPGCWRSHVSGGALFLWLWFPRLRITSRELYEHLKKAGVLAVPGEPFFFGLPDDLRSWHHQRQCLRISYAMSDEVVKEGIRRIGEVVARHSDISA